MKKITIISISIIFLLILSSYLYLQSNQVAIEVEPVVEYKFVKMTINGRTDIESLNREKIEIPLQNFSIQEEAIINKNTTGQQVVGISYARGNVKIINHGDKDISLPVGTRILAEDGTAYLTVKEVEVPAKEINYFMDLTVGSQAGQAEVPVRAENKGSQGNLAPGKIKKFLPAKGNLSVINPAAISGGKDDVKNIVSKEDQSEAVEELKNKLKDQLLARAYQKLGGNYRFVEKDLVYQNYNYQFSKSVGEYASEYRISGSMELRGQLIRHNDLDRLVTYLAYQKYNQANKQVMPGINIESMQLAKSSDNSYNVILELVIPVLDEIDRFKLTYQLAGKVIKEAEDILSSHQEVATFSIPDNLQRLPWLPLAINVKLKEPGLKQTFKIE